METKEFFQAMFYFSQDFLNLYRRHVEALEKLAGVDVEAETVKRVAASREAARGLATLMAGATKGGKPY